MSAKISLHLSDSCHGVGIYFESKSPADARTFIKFMMDHDKSQIYGNPPFWQSSSCRHSIAGAENSTYEYFEYLHVGESDTYAENKLLEILEAAGKETGLEIYIQ